MNEFTKKKNIFSRLTIRLLQHIARFMPGGRGFRVYCHRLRGVKIGKKVFIGYDAIIETEHPELITIMDEADIGMNTTIIAHNHGSFEIHIEEKVVVGPGSIVLPGVTIGKGSVVAAGSVVTRSIPPMTFVQGNPAVPVAKCGIPLTPDISMQEFMKNLKPLKSKKPVVKNETAVS